jgi:hypothetical protein
LTVDLVSFDTDSGSFLNYPMAEMARTLGGQPNELGWNVRPSSDYPNGLESARHDVLGQKSWATVVINANATSAWREAVTTGDANFDPTGAITIYIQTARFYQVSLLYVEAFASFRASYIE